MKYYAQYLKKNEGIICSNATKAYVITPEELFAEASGRCSVFNR